MSRRRDFDKVLDLTQALESAKMNLMVQVANHSGGPRDQQFREKVLTLTTLLLQLGVKSQLLPDEGLALVGMEMNRLIAGFRQMMASEGIEIPGAACRERVMIFPDKQVGVMYEHGKTEPYEGQIPAGYEIAFISTVGDKQEIRLMTIGSDPVIKMVPRQ